MDTIERMAKDVMLYYQFRAELSVVDGVVSKEDRVVILLNHAERNKGKFIWGK